MVTWSRSLIRPYWQHKEKYRIGQNIRQPFSPRNRSEKVGLSYIRGLVFREQLIFFASPFKCRYTFAAPGGAKNWFREEVVQHP